MEKKIALVTGANRGIGLEVAKEIARLGYKVLAGSRDAAKGAAALQGIGGDIEAVSLDTSDAASIERVFQEIKTKYGRLDALVNNAGILIDDRSKPAIHSDASLLTKTFQTNTMGPFLLCQKFLPLMTKNGYGRIVNVSSGMGQLTDMEGGYPAYRLSKTALNAVTRIFAAEAGHPKILVNSVCPGWVKTDMGGSAAHRTVQQGAETIVWLATSDEVKATGGFFRDKEPIPW